MKRIRSALLFTLVPGSLALCSCKFTPALPDLHHDDQPLQYTFPSLLRFCLHRFPDRIMSRIFGSVSSAHIPGLFRSPIYSTWAWVFNADLAACQYPLRSYQSLQEFFTRSLHKHSRPIHSADIISPADGVVTVFGEVTPEGRLDQVKGVSYCLPSFLRCQPRPRSNENSLYYAVVYLGPGDYHRIHSPSAWALCSRSHIPGDLFPVNPAIVKYVPALFSLNERVVLTGNWRHGFFSLTAVGAYNVGSIYFNFDPDLVTNTSTVPPAVDDRGKAIVHGRTFDNLPVRPGEELGRFMLGSTVVLVWEAPDFRFSIKPGDRVKMGQELGYANSSL